MSSNPDLHARFVQEAKSISSLQHPNLCVVHDIGSQDGLDYMVMEYVSGQTLDRTIPKGGLPVNVATKYALQVADALARAHSAGILHRDLKPANIMVDESGLVKVLDIGLAKLAAAESANNDAGAPLTGAGTATAPGRIVGTLAYMSPEQAEGKPVDARSDIFSSGQCSTKCLRARRPSTLSLARHCQLRSCVMIPTPLSELKRDVPAELRTLVARCLKKKLADRFPSGGELAQELRRDRDLLFPESGATLTPARLVREAKRLRILVPLLALLILLGVGVGWLVQHNREARWARDVGVSAALAFFLWAASPG